MNKLFNLLFNKITEFWMIVGITICQRTLGKIPRINNGGCGIAAYSMFLYLKKMKMLNKKFQIVSLNPIYGSEPHYQNQAFANKESDEAAVAYHFGITFDEGKTIYDAKGKVSEEYALKLLIPHELSEAFCKKVLNENNWNEAFLREEHVPIIELKLKIKISY